MPEPDAAPRQPGTPRDNPAPLSVAVAPTRTRPAGEHDPGCRNPAIVVARQLAKRRAAVLCIEGNLPCLTLLERILEHHDAGELIPATTATIGLKLAHDHHPDLILLDLHLPDMPGADLLKHLKTDRRTREIPVIVLTADATGSQSETVRQFGAAGYFTKPFDIHELFETIAHHLDPPPPSTREGDLPGSPHAGRPRLSSHRHVTRGDL